jgi:hypothetical protein
MRTLRLYIVAGAAVSLLGCGQKGPLVLPDAQRPHKKIGIPRPPPAPAPQSPPQGVAPRAPAPSDPVSNAPAPAASVSGAPAGGAATSTGPASGAPAPP